MESTENLTSLAATLSSVAGQLRSAASKGHNTGLVIFDNLDSDSDNSDNDEAVVPVKALVQPTGLHLFDEQKLIWRPVHLSEWALDPNAASAFVRHDKHGNAIDTGVLEQVEELTPTEHRHLKRNLNAYVTCQTEATGFRVLNV